MRPVTMMISQFRADTKEGENLHFEQCKGGYFSDKDEYGLKVVGKTFQDGTPTPDAPVPIQCVKTGTKVRCTGKNLFDNTFITDKTYANGSKVTKNADGSITVIKHLGDMVKFQSYIPLTAGTYTLSNGLSATCYIYPQVLVEGSAKVTIDKSTCTFSVSNDGLYQITLYSGMNIDGVEATLKIQLEQGNIATEYEPYVFGGEISTPCDLYEGDAWYPMTGRIEKYTRCVELTGTESWGLPVSKLNGLSSYRLVNFYDNVLRSNPYSEHFIGHANSDYVTMTEDCIINYYNTTQLIVICRNEIADSQQQTSTDAWQVWLKAQCDGGTPVNIYYRSATPIIEQSSPQAIFAPSGTVNVIQTPIELTADMSATVMTRR